MTIQVESQRLVGAAAVDEVMAATGLAGLASERVAARWRRSGGVQERTLLTATLDSRPVGAALLVRRPGTASCTLNGLSTTTDTTVTDALIATAEAEAWSAGDALLKVSVDADDNLTPARLDRRGFVELPAPHVPSPYPHDDRDVPRGFVLHRDGATVPTMGYMRQTTEFTCGPVAISMGMAHLGLAPAPDRTSEIALWREATLIGACDPYGLAMASASRSVPTRVVMSTVEPILLEDVTNDPSTTELRTAIQADFAARTVKAGTLVEHRRFSVAELAPLVDAGAVVTVLIDQSPMHADADPHWIVIYGRLGDILLANDPWTDEHLGETWVDGACLAIPPALMELLAGYGDPPYRAMVVLG